MNDFAILALCFAVLVFARVILRINSGEGTPSQEYQDFVIRRDQLKQIEAAKAAEYAERQAYLWQLAQQEQDAADLELAEQQESNFGWNGKKWEWD